MVEKRQNQDLGACELKSLFVFSICFDWSNERYHLLLLLGEIPPPPPPSLASETVLWFRSVDLRHQTAKGFLPLAQAACGVHAYGVSQALPATETNFDWLHTPQVPMNSWALLCLPRMTNPPLILTGVVIAGHKHFHDKQHGDKQTACNTAARRPGKSVWIPYRKRRFQNQGNQGGKSWDVCQECWLARRPAAAV